MRQLPHALGAACTASPSVFGRGILMFDGVDRHKLAELGDVRTPSIADLFVAVMGDKVGEAPAGALRGAAI